MEKNYSSMDELIAEYGFGFDKMEDNTPKEEVIVVEEKQEEPKESDIEIKCKKCEQEFIWTIAEQQFYKEKGFFRPSVCKNCRKKKKVVNNFHKDM